MYLLLKLPCNFCAPFASFPEVVDLRLRKSRWVKSGINCQLFLHCSVPDVFYFYLKGHSFFESVKSVSAFNDHKNQLCRINVASAANSWYQGANLQNLIYIGKLISGTATYGTGWHQLSKIFNVWSKIFNVCYAFVAGRQFPW